MFHHHVAALLKGGRVPVGVGITTLTHRIKAKRLHALRGQLGVEPLGQHVLGHSLGIFVDLGDADVTVHHCKSCSLQRCLQLTDHREICTQRHKRHIGFMSQHCGGHHLAVL